MVGNPATSCGVVRSPPMTHSATAARKLGKSRHWPAWALFLKGFIKHPVMVGSLIPSSPALIDHMLSRVDWTNCRLFVEYGPGVGSFTHPILDRLAPDATYIAIDLNPDFIDYLSATVADSRFRPILGSAADVAQILHDSGFQQADYVLSGLPFSTLAPGLGARIAAATADILAPQGAFLVYQFRDRVRDFLAPHFQQIEIAREYWNIPPCVLFWAGAPKRT